MKSPSSIVWFKQDLRLSDNLALLEAAHLGTLLPIYILDPSIPPPFKLGSATKIYLHYSLNALNKSLNNKLNFYIGDPQTIILKLIEHYKVQTIFWNRSYEPWFREQEAAIESQLNQFNLKSRAFESCYLWDPAHIKKEDGTYYKVFTAYKKKATLISPRNPFPQPEKLVLIKDKQNPTTLEDFKLIPNHKWPKKILGYWEFGEEAAQKKLNNFIKTRLKGYKEGRDYPSFKQTSELSPALHFGEISPHQIIQAIEKSPLSNSLEEDKHSFLNELIWREFSCYLMFHFKDLASENFQSKFNTFPWKDNPIFLEAWKKGKTGYPLVDAGMRELWQTGTLHNRVRMVVASFLIKNLMIHWHQGRDWFWHCLVDADLANNSFNWQWVAGSGADAAPYFRIFNPTTQGKKFDTKGLYTKKFVPELKHLPNRYLFEPWLAPEKILKEAGITLGITYPKPIVDLKSSRSAALAAYHSLKY